jgi:hypothetical protein
MSDKRAIRTALCFYEMQHIQMTPDCLIVFFTNYASCEISNICSISATAMLIYTTWLVSSTIFAYFSRTKHFNAKHAYSVGRILPRIHDSRPRKFYSDDVEKNPPRRKRRLAKIDERKASLVSASSVAAPRLIYHHHDTTVLSVACLLARRIISQHADVWE